MESASPRRKIMHLLDYAASYLPRRAGIWDAFQGLVQRIKRAVTFGQKPPPVSPTASLPSSHQGTEPSAPPFKPGDIHLQAQELGSGSADTLGESQAKHLGPDVINKQQSAHSTLMRMHHDSCTGNDVSLAEYESQPDTRYPTEDDIVKSISQAIEDAAPRASASSVRETYESRVKGLGDAYNRMVRESDRPSKASGAGPVKDNGNQTNAKSKANEAGPVKDDGNADSKANGAGPIDDYGNQVAEYVFSSVLVALPQPRLSGHGTETPLQPPVYTNLEKNIAHTEIDSTSIGLPSDTATPFADKRSAGWELKATPANNTWHRELYSGLCLDRTTIRLVGIQPGIPDDSIQVCMGVHSLEELAMPYEALSYFWGLSEPAKEIRVNNVKSTIGPNLYDAIRSLRQRDSVRHIWIDAICLDQTSPAEKSKEVQKMGQIYSQAKTVNVFLGAPSPSR
ncbi:hypothetical protein LTR85_001476 [Meristemomyces frigidus]|nr:hypothetical protein LTR85_001476 [Meristemomyces frigidus]